MAWWLVICLQIFSLHSLQHLPWSIIKFILLTFIVSNILPIKYKHIKKNDKYELLESVTNFFWLPVLINQQVHESQILTAINYKIILQDTIKTYKILPDKYLEGWTNAKLFSCIIFIDNI